MLRGHLTRTRFVAVLGVAAGVLIGAVVGQPGTGRAASGNTKPKPTTPFTVPRSAVARVVVHNKNKSQKACANMLRFSKNEIRSAKTEKPDFTCSTLYFIFLQPQKQYFLNPKKTPG